MAHFSIRPAHLDDVPLILDLIRSLADYEKLSHQVMADPQILHESLFGPHPAAEVRLGFVGDDPACFAVFFHNFSTFLGRPGLYLEDLYVLPEHRGRGYGRRMLRHLAGLALERGCGRFEWCVLDWNEPAIRFYQKMGAEVMPDWRICRMTGGDLEALARS